MPVPYCDRYIWDLSNIKHSISKSRVWLQPYNVRSASMVATIEIKDAGMVATMHDLGVLVWLQP